MHADELGSVIATSDGSANRVYTYSPYGEPDAWNSTSVTFPRFRYTGQITLDANLRTTTPVQLYHYKARVYDPDIGRFLQTDPVGYQGGMNLYAYVMNDPLNGADPSGLLTCSGDKDKCDTITQDAQRASAALRSAQRRLNNLASGRNNRETRQTRRAFERVYGRGSATAENVGRIAEAAGAAADWLDSPDTQAVVGGLGRDWGANTVGNTIYVHDGYFSRDVGYGRPREQSGQTRAGILIHESGHGVGMPHDYYRIPIPGGGMGKLPYGREGIPANLNAYGTEEQLGLADAFRCAVSSGQLSTCP